MAAISSILPTNVLRNPKGVCTRSHQAPLAVKASSLSCGAPGTSRLSFPRTRTRSKSFPVVSVTAEASAAPEAARRLYVGNIPRTVSNEELANIFQEHASVEKAEVMYDKYSGRSRRFAFVTMSTTEDANVAIEKLNETEIGGRKIKVNVTEQPLATPDLSVTQAEESSFVDSPYKVYVGNLSKSVSSEVISNFFSEKGKVLSAKVSRVPGTSKSSGFGFVTFSSEEDVEAAIASFNNAVLEGQKIRVNKA